MKICNLDYFSLTQAELKIPIVGCERRGLIINNFLLIILAKMNQRWKSLLLQISKD